MTPRLDDNGFQLANQYRNSLIAVIFALIFGAYAYAYTVQQSNEREQGKAEARTAAQFQEIKAQLNRIENRLEKR